MTDFIKIGHRGAAGYEPENTLRSFAKAIQLRCDAIEFDVHLAASGELVIIHDATLERTTNGSGEVGDKSLAELKMLDAGLGETIPTLQEALNLIDRKAVVNIELKGEGALKPAAEVIQNYMSARGWPSGDFMVSSFNHLDLWRLKELLPMIRTGALIETITPGFADFAEEMKCYSVNAPASGVTRQFVEEIHNKEIKVFVFTVDEPEEIQKIKSLGVDGIFSNYPDRL